MKFKLWLTNEDTKLARQFKSEGSEIPLGKFGRFNSIYIHKNNTPDNSKEALQILQQSAPEANYRLSYLGFPSHKSKLIINDGYSHEHPIQGGSSASFGYASRTQHGMTISLEAMKINAVDTLVHEYAHMYWFMMSPKAKNLFINQYQQFYDQLTDEDIQQNVKPEILHKFVQKLQAYNLPNKIINIVQNEYHKSGQNIPIMKFLTNPKNKELLINQISSAIHSFFIHHDFPVQDGKTYLGDDSEFSTSSTQSITAEKLLDKIITSYNFFHTINQGTEDINYFFKSHILHDYIDKELVQAGEKYLKKYISKPSGELARYSMAQKFKLPSSYSAANYDELWAETVEEASRNIKNLNPLLKKLLMNAIFLSR